MSTFLVAEAASAHDGDYDKAMRLVELAAEVGFDAVKFQWWADADQLADRRGVEQHYREIYHRYQMPADWLSTLAAAAAHFGLDFLCTAYVKEDIHVIEPWVAAFKVSSFEAGDDEFLAAHQGKPLVVSTGMMDLIAVVEMATRHRHIGTVLHCTSAYPCPPESANLASIKTLCSLLRPSVGLSDHTADPLTGALAVALGAKWVEAHVRLSDTDPANPDFPAALGPGGAKLYVANVRKAEAMLGRGDKRPDPAEAAMLPYRTLAPE